MLRVCQYSRYIRENTVNLDRFCLFSREYYFMNIRFQEFTEIYKLRMFTHTAHVVFTFLHITAKFTTRSEYKPGLHVAVIMATSLTELCGGLPLDPLPPLRSRNPSLPHAPVRTPNLSPEEKKVSQ